MLIFGIIIEITVTRRVARMHFKRTDVKIFILGSVRGIGDEERRQRINGQVVRKKN